MSDPVEIPQPAPNLERPSSQYEFDAAQNALLGDLGLKMRFVGMFALVIGVLVLLGSVLALNTNINASVYDLSGAFISGLLYIVLGAWTRSAGASFTRVVATKGADISHLMDALADVRQVYTLFYWICVLSIALLIISLILLALAGPPAPMGPVRI